MYLGAIANGNHRNCLSSVFVYSKHYLCLLEYVQTMKIRRFYFHAIVEPQSSYSHCTIIFECDNLGYGNTFYKVTF